MYEKLARHLTKTLFSQTWGAGLLSPDRTTFYVNIPKNASSFTNSWLVENGWTIFNYKDIPQTPTKLQSITVILRDPLNRLVSGFAQYLKSNIIFPPWAKTDSEFTIDDIKKYWPMVERIMADQVCWFDDHTWPQYYFYESILPELPRNYFWCNRHLKHNLKTHFGLNEPSESVYKNSNITSQQDPIMSQMQDLIKQTLEKADYSTQVKQILEPDYSIINARKFIHYLEN